MKEIDIKKIEESIVDFFNLDYDLYLLERIENNKPISKNEYFYYEYSLPLKIMCLKSLSNKTNIRGDKNV